MLAILNYICFLHNTYLSYNHYNSSQKNFVNILFLFINFLIIRNYSDPIMKRFIMWINMYEAT
jgi:hypothetical protein